MKYIKLLLLLVFVLTGAIAKGEAFFEKGKYWIYKDYMPGPDGEDIEPTYHKVSVVGDTVVNNEIAVRLCSESIDPKSDRKFYYAAKEENGRISVFHYSKGTFVPVVDFSLHVGDLASHCMEIMNEGMGNINGIDRRIVTVNPCFRMIDHWIEGVGATGNSGFITPFPNRLGFQQDIIGCYVGDRQIYSENSLDEYISREPRPYIYDKMIQDLCRSWIFSIKYWDHSVGRERWTYRRFEVVEDVVVAGIPCKKIIETSLDPTSEDYDNPSSTMYASVFKSVFKIFGKNFGGSEKSVNFAVRKPTGHWMGSLRSLSATCLASGQIWLLATTPVAGYRPEREVPSMDKKC